MRIETTSRFNGFPKICPNIEQVNFALPWLPQGYSTGEKTPETRNEIMGKRKTTCRFIPNIAAFVRSKFRIYRPRSCYIDTELSCILTQSAISDF